MPFADLSTHRLHYRIEGREDALWLTFCNSLGTDLHMWDPQVDALAAHFRILRYDRRGHGQSDTPPGLYEVADLGRDVLALWDALGIERSHFCGLSIGGLTGQWLGLNATARLQRLVVCATAAKIGSAESWTQRIEQVRRDGLTALAEGTVQRWFTPAFVAAHPLVIDEIVTGFLETSREGYIGCCNAVAQADFRGALAGIAVPLLAIAGDDDPVCAPHELQYIVNEVADGRFAQVPGRHICNLESPPQFSALLLDFLRA
ncbi:MAG: 3-oxoadipate enol-lactonase [Pseudomonas sp.]